MKASVLLALLILAGAPGLAQAGESGQPQTLQPPPDFNQCSKVAPGRRVKLNLKPDTEVVDLVRVMSTITCTPFLISSTVATAGKKVTLLTPQPLTVAELERLFYAALDSVGLTVEPNGRILRIVDAAHARMSSIPYYGAQ
jgi:general secretion pathway protein D